MINFQQDFYLLSTNIINFINLNDKELEIIRKWRNNNDICIWMYNAHKISSNEHKNFINKLKKNNTDFYWLVKDKKGSNIGVIYLNRVDFLHRNAYLGIYKDPNLSGVGELLMDSLKEIAFKIAKLHTLKLEVIETNKEAIRFYKKMGFKEEGRLKEFVYRDGKWLDVIIMGLVNKND